MTLPATHVSCSLPLSIQLSLSSLCPHPSVSLSLPYRHLLLAPLSSPWGLRVSRFVSGVIDPRSWKLFGPKLYLPSSLGNLFGLQTSLSCLYSILSEWWGWRCVLALEHFPSLSKTSGSILSYTACIHTRASIYMYTEYWKVVMKIKSYITLM